MKKRDSERFTMIGTGETGSADDAPNPPVGGPASSSVEPEQGGSTSASLGPATDPAGAAVDSGVEVFPWGESGRWAAEQSVRRGIRWNAERRYRTRLRPEATSLQS